jgi:hypothetical protein
MCDLNLFTIVQRRVLSIFVMGVLPIFGEVRPSPGEWTKCASAVSSAVV